MKIQQIRNATLKINYAGKTFLIDPMLSEKGTLPPFGQPEVPFPPASGNMEKNPLVELPISVDKILSDIDALIVTHTHLDHWDPAAIELIDKNIPTYVQNEEDATLVREQGFKNVYVLDENTRFENISLTYVEARHATADEVLPLAGHACGVIFEHKNEPTTYLLGDTIWYNVVEETLIKVKPDVAIINAGNNQFSVGGPLIMNAEGVLNVHKTLPTAKLFATHMEDVNHAFLTKEELRNFAKENNFDNILSVPENGEVVEYK